jgi:hypothetical protein
MWYTQLCEANPLPKKTNPVTGITQSYKKNALGVGVYANQGFSVCRDCNKEGNCNQFQEA